MDAESLKAAGNALLGARKPKEALAKYEAGILAEPTNHALLSNASAVLLELGRTGESEAMARRCISCLPSWAKGHFRLGMALEAQRRYEDALSAYEAALSLEPTSDTIKTCCSRMQSTHPVGLAWVEGAKVFTQHAYWVDANPSLALVASFKEAHAAAASTMGLSSAQITAEQYLFDIPFIWGAMGPGGVDAIELPPRASFLCGAVRFIVTSLPASVVRAGEAY